MRRWKRKTFGAAVLVLPAVALAVLVGAGPPADARPGTGTEAPGDRLHTRWTWHRLGPDGVPGRLRVRALSADGPVAGARVEVRRDEDLLATGTTDGSGEALLCDLPAGDVRVLVRSPRLVGRDPWVVVPEGGLEIAPVRLEPPESLSGRVVAAADGSPVAGAGVAVLTTFRMGFDLNTWCFGTVEDRLGEGVTAEDGRFELSGLPRGGAGLLLRVVADGFRTTCVEPDRDGPIRLVPGASISGRVTDRDGRGVAGARVFATPARWRDEIYLDVVFLPFSLEEGFPGLSTVTDAAGRYSIEGLGRGDHYAVTVLREGFDRGRVGDVRAPSAAADVRLEPGSPGTNILDTAYRDGDRHRGPEEVRGFVRTPDGRPFAGAEVRLVPAKRRTRTETDGSFRIEGVPTGEGVLEVRTRPGDLFDVGHASVKVPGPAVEIVAASATVRGTLVLPRPARPDDDVRVDVDTSEDDVRLRPVPGSRRIDFEFPAWPGRVRLEFDTNVYRPLEWNGRLAAGERRDLGELVVRPWRTVRGRVVDEERKPVAGARVNACGPTVLTGADGRFDIDEFFLEPETLVVDADDFEREYAPVPPVGEEALVRLRASVAVSVVVRDSEGNPLPLVAVWLSRPNGSAAGSDSSTRTATDGSARLSAPPGQYELRVATPWNTRVERELTLDRERPPDPVEIRVD